MSAGWRSSHRSSEATDASVFPRAVPQHRRGILLRSGRAISVRTVGVAVSNVPSHMSQHVRRIPPSFVGCDTMASPRVQRFLASYLVLIINLVSRAGLEPATL